MTAEETRKKALSLLERRDYGSEELCAKLVEKGAGPDEARAAVRYMVRVGFIDDERYAAMVVRHYAAKGYGVGRVREELRRRKLDRELWDAALAELRRARCGGPGRRGEENRFRGAFLEQQQRVGRGHAR